MTPDKSVIASEAKQSIGSWYVSGLLRFTCNDDGGLFSIPPPYPARNSAIAAPSSGFTTELIWLPGTSA